jgi:hypothetical protein
VSEDPKESPDGEGLEILRAWIQDDTLHCSLLAGAFNDPGIWGTVLADLARHAAEAMCQDEGIDPTEALARIREAFSEELDSTDEPEAEATE